MEAGEPKLTAPDCESKAERLAKTARLGDQVAQRVIEAYKQMARHLREREIPAYIRAQ